jgi:hypothetical protein
MISGKGSTVKVRARKARPAAHQPAAPLIARPPMRIRACSTRATTAAFSPSRAGPAQAARPCATYSADRPSITSRPGSTNSSPAAIPPRTPCSRQPSQVASCWASGPGSSMQKLRAWAKRSSSIQARRSTTSRCSRAIWPAGPPKPRQPTLSQTQNASRKLGRVPPSSRAPDPRLGAGVAEVVGQPGRDLGDRALGGLGRPDHDHRAAVHLHRIRQRPQAQLRS